MKTVLQFREAVAENEDGLNLTVEIIGDNKIVEWMMNAVRKDIENLNKKSDIEYEEI